MGFPRHDARLRALPAEALHEFLLRISRIDRFRGWWEGRDRLPAPFLGRLRKRAVETSARATLSPSAGTVSGAAPGREAGYAALLRAVFDGYREMTFGEELIRRFHAELLRSSPGDRSPRGAYRTLSDRPPALSRGGPESPALRPPDPLHVPAEMTALAGWAAAALDSTAFHPLLVIPSFLLEFLAILPFSSGNGRTSRILANYLLLRSGYSYLPYLSLEKTIAARRTEYLLALRRSQSLRNLPRPDISSWLRVFLEILEAQADELRGVAAGRPAHDRLSGNQRAVLALLERDGEVSTRAVRRELGIPRDTAKQVLGRLLRLSLVKRTGAGRATRYRKALPPTE